MNVHNNARLTPSGRALLAERVEVGWPVKAAAIAAGVSTRTAHTWLAAPASAQGGERRHHDRSSRCPHATPARRLAELVVLRRQRLSRPRITRRSLACRARPWESSCAVWD